ncbi:MAG: ABC transporter transmembrane domain-containing protein, partial [bacterium]|nr:ABC transporter transmembrane domain-containing protein [bacterium]
MDRASLPELLQHYFKENYADETLHVAIASDVTKQLIYGEEWLIATDKRIATFAAHNGNAEIISSHQLSDIKKVESVNLTGSGVIEISVNDRSHRLIYYSNAKNADFAWAIEQIKMLLDGNAIEPDKHERKRRICESCGYPIPEDLNKCPRCTEKGKTLRRILQFTKPYLGQLFFIFLTLIAGIIFGLVTPYMSKLFIDVILKPDATTGLFQHAHWIPLAALALFAAYAGQNFFSGLHMRLAGIVGHKTVFDVRAAIYQKLQDLSLAFFDKHQTGALMARVNQDTRELQHFLVDFIPLSLESLFILVGVGIFLSILSWQLTLFVFIPIIATVLFLKNIFSKIRLYFRRYYHRRSRLSALVNDSLSGMRVIKAFGQEGEESNKFERKSAAFRDAGIDLENKWSIYSPTLQLLIMSGTVLVWFVGGKLIV